MIDLCVLTEIKKIDLPRLSQHIGSLVRQRFGISEWRVWSSDLTEKELQTACGLNVSDSWPTVISPEKSLIKVLESVTQEYAFFLRGSDVLAPRSLPRIQRELMVGGDVDLLYGDETYLSNDGDSVLPLFRPGWGPLLESNMGVIGDCPVVKVETIRNHGVSNGHFLWGDFALRTVDSDLRLIHVPSILVNRSQETRQRSTQTIFNEQSFPTISVIVPTIGTLLTQDKDSRTLVERCINLMYSHADKPENIEIVVVFDQGTPPEALLAIEELNLQNLIMLQHDRKGEGFNFSTMVNTAALAASGEVLVMLNDDVEITLQGWDLLLARTALISEVGAVGVTLLFPDRSIQHAGVTTQYDHGGLTIHTCYGLPVDHSDQLDVLGISRESHAVTGALLAVGREAFLSVGGLSTEFPSDYNDTALCWKLQSLSLSTVMMPQVFGIHRESSTRSIQFSYNVASRLQDLWGSSARQDPWRNPNIAHEDLMAKPDWTVWERSYPTREVNALLPYPQDKAEKWVHFRGQLLQPRMRRLLG